GDRTRICHERLIATVAVACRKRPRKRRPRAPAAVAACQWSRPSGRSLASAAAQAVVVRCRSLHRPQSHAGSRKSGGGGGDGDRREIRDFLRKLQFCH
ncbi:hypothetical protein GW17_00053325, partial [Ensete ventricosum]